MNQHYIPQFYQKGWAAKIGNQENQIFVYRKHRIPKYYSIKRRVGCADNYYGFTAKDGSHDIHTIEFQLGALEQQTSPIFQKIENRVVLTNDEKRTLSEFICVFWRRVPYHRIEHDQKMQKFAPQFFVDLKKELGNLGIEQENRLFKEVARLETEYARELPDSFYPKSVTRDSQIVDAMMAMDWVFITAPRFMPFLTCDNPFVFSRGPGIGHPKHGHIIFPLCKSVVLQMTQFTRFRDSYQPVDELLAYDINKRIVGNAHMEVYSHQRWPALDSFVDQWMGTDLPK